MVMWYYTASNFWHAGLAGEPAGVADRMGFLWACTSTFLGVILIVVLEQAEHELTKHGEKKKREAEDTGLPLKTHWTEHAIAFSNILQRGLSWVAGCAWSDELFAWAPSLSADPYVSTIIKNLVLISALTLISLVWLIATAPNPGAAAASMSDRSEVEKTFISDAMAFFVLSGWLVVVRNLFVQFAVGTEVVIAFADKTFGFSTPPKMGDTVAVLFFAPLVTVLAFNAAESIMLKLARRAHTELHGSKAGAEKEKKEAMLEWKEDMKERDLDAEKLARRKLLANESLVMLVFAGKMKLARELMDYKLENGGVKTVCDFLEGAAVFVLSRMWSDLISVFIFGLHAIPYCNGFVHAQCSPEAPAKHQFIYVVCTLPVAGLLKNIVEVTKLVELPGMWDDIPMILKYIVGWAFGGACQQWLVEIKAANPDLCDGDDCTMINVGFAAAMTVVSALIILIVKPASDVIEWGDGKCINFIEDFVEDTLQMVIRGFEVVAMVLWYYAAYNFTHLGVHNDIDRQHMDLFWAMTLTFLGAIFMVVLESMEQDMKRIKKKDIEKGEFEEEEGKPHWTDAVIQLSDVIQNVVGYVTGCAWADWLFETATVLNAEPYPSTVAINFAIVVALSVGSCYWLIMNTSHDGIEESLEMTEEEKKAKAEAKATDRGEVEKQFIASALGFFVLSGWLTVVRNLFAPFSLLMELGVEYADVNFGFTTPPVTGDLVAVLLFAPIFTVLAFTVSGSVMTRFSKKAGLEEAAKGKAAAAKAEVAKRNSLKRTSSARYSANYSEKDLI
jgi:hypothetical protein